MHAVRRTHYLSNLLFTIPVAAPSLISPCSRTLQYIQTSGCYPLYLRYQSNCILACSSSSMISTLHMLFPIFTNRRYFHNTGHSFIRIGTTKFLFGNCQAFCCASAEIRRSPSSTAPHSLKVNDLDCARPFRDLLCKLPPYETSCISVFRSINRSPSSAAPRSHPPPR